MSKPLWIEGLTNAVGFVSGALLGWLLARMLGLNPLAPDAHGTSVFGSVLVGLGGGMGLQWARRWRAASNRKNTPEI